MTKKWRCPVLDRGSCKYENPGFRLSSIIISTPPPINLILTLIGHQSQSTCTRSDRVCFHIPQFPLNFSSCNLYFVSNPPNGISQNQPTTRLRSDSTKPQQHLGQVQSNSVFIFNYNMQYATHPDLTDTLLFQSIFCPRFELVP